MLSTGYLGQHLKVKSMNFRRKERKIIENVNFTGVCLLQSKCASLSHFLFARI